MIATLNMKAEGGSERDACSCSHYSLPLLVLLALGTRFTSKSKASSGSTIDQAKGKYRYTVPELLRGAQKRGFRLLPSVCRVLVREICPYSYASRLHMLN